MLPAPPSLLDQRSCSNRQPQVLRMRRHSPSREDARPREHNDHREVERFASYYTGEQQGMSFGSQLTSFLNNRGALERRLPPMPPRTGLEMVRRREDERRLADSSRNLAVLRGGDVHAPPQGLSERWHQLQRAAIHEQNRTNELTRLNAVMVQRNNTISEGQLKISEQEQEINKLRNELKKRRKELHDRTNTAVALHEICGRQQDHLKNIAATAYPPGEARTQFEAWVKSNELYMAHAKAKISAANHWDNLVLQANTEAMKDIAKVAAQHASQRMGRQTQPVYQPNGQVFHEGFQDALQQLLDDVSNGSVANPVKK